MSIFLKEILKETKKKLKEISIGSLASAYIIVYTEV